MRKILFLVFVLTVIGGLFVFSGCGKKNNPLPENKKPAVETPAQPKAWVEVFADKIFLKSGGSVQELKSGDEVESGATLATDAAGLADVHLPDGSVIRLDSNTEIILDQAVFGQDDHSLKVKIFLTAGRVWSKILKLATSESFWEVRTSNAVAAVRGTAFGVEFAGGETTILGSENEVSVQAIGPDGRPLAGEAALVGPDKFLKISNAVINAVDAKNTLSKQVKIATPVLLKQPWVLRFKEADGKIEQHLEGLRQSGLSDVEVRDTLIKETLQIKPVEIISPTTTASSSAEGSMSGGTAAPTSTAPVSSPIGGGGTSYTSPVDETSTWVDDATGTPNDYPVGYDLLEGDLPPTGTPGAYNPNVLAP